MTSPTRGKDDQNVDDKRVKEIAVQITDLNELVMNNLSIPLPAVHTMHIYTLPV